MGLVSAARVAAPKSRPLKPPPTHVVVHRLAQRYGDLAIHESAGRRTQVDSGMVRTVRKKPARPANLAVHRPTGHAKWAIIRQKAGKDGGQQQKMPPWRMLRYLVWKTPPLRLLLVSDNLPDSQVGRATIACDAAAHHCQAAASAA